MSGFLGIHGHGLFGSKGILAGIVRQQARYNPVFQPIGAFSKGATGKIAKKNLKVEGIVAGSALAAYGAYQGISALTAGPSIVPNTPTVTGLPGTAGTVPIAPTTSGFSLSGLTSGLKDIVGIGTSLFHPSGGGGNGPNVIAEGGSGGADGGGSGGGGAPFEGGDSSGIAIPGGPNIPTWVIVAGVVGLGLLVWKMRK